MDEPLDLSKKDQDHGINNLRLLKVLIYLQKKGKIKYYRNLKN